MLGRIKPQKEVYMTIDAGEGDYGGEPITCSTVIGTGSYIVAFPGLGKQVIFDYDKLIEEAYNIVTTTESQTSLIERMD